MKNNLLIFVVSLSALGQISLFFACERTYAQKAGGLVLHRPLTGLSGEPWQPGERLYVEIKVGGEINDFEIHDDYGRKFQPYFFYNGKNTPEIQRLKDRRVSDAEFQRLLKEKMEPLPKTDFDANAFQAWVIIGTAETRHLLFPASGIMVIEVLRGNGPLSAHSGPQTPSFAARYRDVSTIPDGAMTRLSVRLDGTVKLTFDANSDGVFEGVVEPTAVLKGRDAQDTQEPKLNIDIRYGRLDATVSITAVDEGTGVAAILFSTEEGSPVGGKNFTTYKNFKPYTGPFTVPHSSKPITIEAFADDKAGNRSYPITKILKF